MLFNTMHHAEGIAFQDTSQILVKIDKFQLTGRRGSEKCRNSETLSTEVTNPAVEL